MVGLGLVERCFTGIPLALKLVHLVLVRLSVLDLVIIMLLDFCAQFFTLSPVVFYCVSSFLELFLENSMDNNKVLVGDAELFCTELISFQ
jgi:hypothetical protein